jgi:hypothetical protein
VHGRGRADSLVKGGAHWFTSGVGSGDGVGVSPTGGDIDGLAGFVRVGFGEGLVFRGNGVMADGVGAGTARRGRDRSTRRGVDKDGDDTTGLDTDGDCDVGTASALWT